MTGDKLHQYHHFLTKLDTAIEHQKVLLEQSEIELSKSRTDWQSDNSRANAIDKAIKNLKNKEAKAGEKKESNQIDELSTQAFLQRKQL